MHHGQITRDKPQGANGLRHVITGVVSKTLGNPATSAWCRCRFCLYPSKSDVLDSVAAPGLSTRASTLYNPPCELVASSLDLLRLHH